MPQPFAFLGIVTLLLATTWKPFIYGVHAEDCLVSLTPQYAAPVVASGWEARLVVTGLVNPRGMVFDQGGALLVADLSRVARITFSDRGGTCLVAKTETLLNGTEFNHGIALSPDEKTLYVSSPETVYAYSYDWATGTVGSNTTIIDNMSPDGHNTRNLYMSKEQPGQLLVHQGSLDNLDTVSRDITSGRSQIRAFDMSRVPCNRPYNYTEGKVVGWGLRNSVGYTEHPVTGGIWSVENSIDDLTRETIDIHSNNPGEELNYLGLLRDAAALPPPNFGYPDCVAVWDLSTVPNPGSLEVGSQMTFTESISTSDSYCSANAVPPRLAFQAHMAPLSILFNPDGSEAYVTFHGSWDRTPPIGYKLTGVAFANGEPVEPSTSTTAAIDIMTNPDLNACPDRCFRPAGLALDSTGRLFLSSDSTGDIYVLIKKD